MATSTPWGLSQEQTKIAPGINFYSTASHGGFHLSAEKNKLVNSELKAAGFAGNPDRGWYEEDCDAAIVVYSFPQYFREEEYKTACDMLARTHTLAWNKIKSI